MLGTPSRRESVVLGLKDLREALGGVVLSAEEVATSGLLGSRAYVNWPYLQEARVVRVSNRNSQVSYDIKGAVKVGGLAGVSWGTTGTSSSNRANRTESHSSRKPPKTSMCLLLQTAFGGRISTGDPTSGNQIMQCAQRHSRIRMSLAPLLNTESRLVDVKPMLLRPVRLEADVDGILQKDMVSIPLLLCTLFHRHQVA